MIPVKADLEHCYYYVWIVLECGFHVKLDFGSCAIMSYFHKSSHNCGKLMYLSTYTLWLTCDKNTFSAVNMCGLAFGCISAWLWCNHNYAVHQLINLKTYILYNVNQHIEILNHPCNTAVENFHAVLVICGINFTMCSLIVNLRKIQLKATLQIYYVIIYAYTCNL